MMRGKAVARLRKERGVGRTGGIAGIDCPSPRRLALFGGNK